MKDSVKNAAQRRRARILRTTGTLVAHLPHPRLGHCLSGAKKARRNGRGSRRADLCRRRRLFGAGVFWQVHPGAAATLGRAVFAGLDASAGDRVADLYAGAGLFAALVGDVVGPRGSVLAVERDRWACADAARNTSDQPHVDVVKAAVTPALVTNRLAGDDLAVLDPSPEGAGRSVMEALARLRPAPRRIVYVACDPASFAVGPSCTARRGRMSAPSGGFDMFPMTEHVELVAVIEPPASGATPAVHRTTAPQRHRPMPARRGDRRRL